MNEIYILRHFQHKSIIRMYEVYESEDFVHLVLEHLKGGELFDKVVEKGMYSEADARKLMQMMLEAIRYCHMNCILHRDLKPENIILT